MNESVMIQKMISIGQNLEREEIFYSGAEADARALLEEIKQALTIPVVNKCDCPPLIACKICGEEKNLDGDFRKNKKKHDG
jgi:hypothetical protein